jgi:hypothetical protein
LLSPPLRQRFFGFTPLFGHFCQSLVIEIVKEWATASDDFWYIFPASQILQPRIAGRLVPRITGLMCS